MLTQKSAGSRGFNCTLHLFSTDVDGCVALPVVANWNTTNCNKDHVLDHVEKVFGDKNSENSQPPFLVTHMYAFMLKIHCKV